MEIVYRSVKEDSFDEVREFLITHEYSFRDSAPDLFVPKTSEKRDEAAKKMLEILAKGEDEYYLLAAYDGDKLVGSHYLHRLNIDYRPACHIHGLWIDQDYRGNGIARKLKELGEQWALSKGCELMDSNVRVSNSPMRTLNEDLGYEVVRYNYRKELK